MLDLGQFLGVQLQPFGIPRQVKGRLLKRQRRGADLLGDRLELLIDLR